MPQNAAVACSQRKVEYARHFTAFKTLTCFVWTVALLYEWTESDWVGYGMFHAPDHFNLKTRGQPERWVIISWNPQQHQLTRWPMADVITSDIYSAIPCCYPAVISRCTEPFYPGLQHSEPIGFACLTHNRGGFKNVPFSVTAFFPSFVCPLTCYITGQLNDCYFPFSACASGKSRNRRGFIIWCNLLQIQFQGSIITASKM